MSNKLNEQLAINPAWINKQLNIEVVDLNDMQSDALVDYFKIQELENIGRLYKHDKNLFIMDLDGFVKNVYAFKEGKTNINFGTRAVSARKEDKDKFGDSIKNKLKDIVDVSDKKPIEENDKEAFDFFDKENKDPDDDDDGDDDDDDYDIGDDDRRKEPDDFKDTKDDEKNDELDVEGIAGINRLDVNGFYEKDLAGGEYLKRTRRNVVHFPPGFHGVADGNEMDTLLLTSQDVRRIFTLNACMLMETGLSLEVSMRIAYLRCLLIERGLISDEWNPKTYSVKYIEAKYHEDNSEYGHLIPNFMKALGKTVLSDDVKSEIAENLNSAICLVAFIFRSRGHHFKIDFLSTINRIAKNCEMPVNKMFINFEQLFTTALHCIPPTVLDKYWKWSVDNGKCKGALVKRYDCAPAGSASIYAIYVGLGDITTLLPQLKVRYKTDYKYLEDTVDYLKTNRWVGSINHTYYGVARFRYDENRFNGLVALVLGALDSFAPDAPLIKAPSLQRVGNNAPVTAAIIGTVLSNIIKSDKYAQSYLLEGSDGKT
jgi:hypothetical protein